jgi:hydroxylaminobenzene mutase
MDSSGRARRLFLHGMVLVLGGLVIGMFVQSVTTPRLGLSAHTGTIMNGLLVVGAGALWPRLALGERVEIVAYWLLVAGSYLSCVSLFMAGVLGTSGATPIAGAGHVGAPWQEALVTAGLSVGGAAVLFGCAAIVWGLAREPE